MAIENNTYEWNCSQVDIRPTENGEVDVIYNIHWRCLGAFSVTDEESVTGQCYGSIKIPIQDSDEFIPFEDITNEILVEWTKQAMGDEEVQEVYEAIDRTIQDKINPTSITKTINID